MKLTFLGLTLLLAVSVFAQQQGQYPSEPPQATPPTFPEGKPAPERPMPPDQQDEHGLSATEAQEQIQQKMSTEPGLRDNAIEVRVDDTSVTLTGAVSSEDQHDLALRIAKSYAGDRDIIDKIKIKQQT